MNMKYLCSILTLFLCIGIVFLIYQSQAIHRTYKAEVLQKLDQNKVSENLALTENDIKDLPGPVQKYMRYVGVIGRGKLQNVRIDFRGKMKMGPQKDWVEVKTTQYNFLTSDLTRLFFIKTKIAAVPIYGLDSYMNGKGNMLIKAAGVFTVANAMGREMDKAAMVTLFDDICLYSPAALVDPRIHWKTVDELTVNGTLRYKGNKVSATLHFNERGELINFVTDDRYYSPTGKTFQKVRWSTPVKDYQEFNGIKAPAYGEGIWHLKTGDYVYAKFRLKRIRYNCQRLTLISS
jgi:hypothetical protein